MFETLIACWQELSATAQDAILFAGYLSPVVLLGILLLTRLHPMTMVSTLLKRHRKINLLIVGILAVCLSVSIAIQASTSAYKTAMAKVANRFELVVTAPGSKTDMMLATVYLQPTPTPLLQGDIYEKIANDPKVDIVAPIAYGDSYAGHPIVGSTNAFVNYLADGKVSGNLFQQTHQAIIGAGVDLQIGDTLTPQHGVQKSFSPALSKVRLQTNHASASTAPRPEKQSTRQPEAEKTVHQASDKSLFSSKDNNGNSYYCPVSLTDQEVETAIFGKPIRQSAHTTSLTVTKTSQADPQSSETAQAQKTAPATGHSTSHDATITVVGKMPITHSPWDKAIITPVESVWLLHGLPTGHAPDETHLGEPFTMEHFAGTPAILVHPHKPFQAYALSNKYTSKDAMAFRPPTVLSKLNAQLDDMTDILTRVAWVMIGLVLCLALVAIALLSKLFEKHFQLLTALGSPKRFIVSILWSYVTCLALCATVLGCLLGYGLSLHLASYVEARLSVLLQIQFGWTEFTLCAMFFALSSLLGLIPAFSRFRKV